MGGHGSIIVWTSNIIIIILCSYLLWFIHLFRIVVNNQILFNDIIHHINQLWFLILFGELTGSIFSNLHVSAPTLNYNRYRYFIHFYSTPTIKTRKISSRSLSSCHINVNNTCINSYSYDWVSFFFLCC